MAPNSWQIYCRNAVSLLPMRTALWAISASDTEGRNELCQYYSLQFVANLTCTNEDRVVNVELPQHGRLDAVQK